jgi:hypothetical protein
LSAPVFLDGGQADVRAGQGLFPFYLQPAVQFLFNSLLEMDPQGFLPGLANGVCGSRGRVYTPSILEEAAVTRQPAAGQNSPATNGLAPLGEFDMLGVAVARRQGR